ncbi:MAG: nucleotide exchange factor GrpE [Candidatus Bathyarchaeia archaeon]
MSEEQKQTSKDEEKLEKLAHALVEEKKRSEECLTRLKYMQADFENYRKWTDRQMEEIRRYSNERIIVQLLDVVDELEMAIKSACSTNSKETLTEGVEMTLSKLKKVLEKEGVSPIECLGKPFDSSKHDAVSKVEKDDVKGCTVIEEIRKGYNMKEKVIRPSVVKVAVKPLSDSQKGVEPK